MKADLFLTMAHNNAWSNYQLLKACAALSQADYEAERTGFFPSIKLTLHHILEVDRYYIDAMEGGTLGQAAWDIAPPLTLAEQKSEQSHWDQRLITLCQGLTEARLENQVQLIRIDQLQRERLDRTLLHLLQHQIHHRGQAHAMLSSTSVAPPQLDEFFLEGDADLRVEDDYLRS